MSAMDVDFEPVAKELKAIPVAKRMKNAEGRK